MKKEIIEILKKLLKYETINGKDTELSNAFDYIKSIISEKLIVKEYEFNKKKSLVISNIDTYNYDVIFCVHVDVVPIDKFVFSEDKDNIYGRGTIDMKGQVASCICLMNHIKINKKVALFITSDEEIDGNCTVELLKIYDSKFAIVPDGGQNFELIQEEKGLLQLKLSINTKSAHSSQPFNGINAITSLTNLYNKLLEKYPLPINNDDYVTSINLSMINGGDALNKVPSNATMFLDIRFTSQKIKEEIINSIKKFNKNIKIEILLDGSDFKTNLNNNYVKKYIESSEKILQKKINIVKCNSTSDAVYFYEKNVPTIIMNPIGGNPHCNNEYVNKESLYSLYKIYIEFLNKY